MFERRVDVDGVPTRYLEAGDPAAPAMVMLHGGEFGSYVLADDWRPVVPLLADRFRLVLPDLLGCGYTAGPSSPNELLFSRVVAHAAAVLRFLGIERMHLVGHSRGGFVATLLALEFQSAVDSLVIVGGGTLVTPPNPIYDDWAKQAAAIADPRDRVRYLVEANSYDGAHIDDDYITAMSQAILTEESIRLQKQFRGTVRERFHAELASLAATARRRIRAGELTAPTLVMWGYEDPSARVDVAGIASMELFLGGVPRAAMHIVNRAGHYCYRERPHEFSAVVKAFIDSGHGFAVPANRLDSGAGRLKGA